MGSSGLSLRDPGSSSSIAATTPVFCFLTACQLSYLWSCSGKQISEMLQIIKMILLTIFIIIMNLKGEGKGGNVLNYFPCWTDSDAGPSAFWRHRLKAWYNSVRNFPGACGSLTGLKDTFFQKKKKKYCVLKQSAKQVEKRLKPQKSFPPRICPAACPPPKLMRWLIRIYIPRASHGICCYTFVAGSCLRTAGDNPLPLAFFCRDFSLVSCCFDVRPSVGKTSPFTLIRTSHLSTCQLTTHLLFF